MLISHVDLPASPRFSFHRLRHPFLTMRVLASEQLLRDAMSDSETAKATSCAALEAAANATDATDTAAATETVLPTIDALEASIAHAESLHADPALVAAARDALPALRAAAAIETLHYSATLSHDPDEIARALEQVRSSREDLPSSMAFDATSMPLPCHLHALPCPSMRISDIGRVRSSRPGPAASWRCESTRGVSRALRNDSPASTSLSLSR